jgi:hypothetical protein
MTFYSDLDATAKELLAEFGAPMVLTRTTEGDYDPAQAGSVNTSVDYSCEGVKLNYEEKFIDGTRIKTGDQQVLLSTTITVTPEQGDTITIDSELWKVVKVETVKPAEVALLYKLQVRQ